MTVQVAATLGAWIFAAACGISAEVSGFGMGLAWACAVIITMVCLK